MAKDTRSAEKIKQAEESNSKGKHISTRVSCPTTNDAFGLRRSCRNSTVPENDMVGSPSGMQESERREKLTSATSAIGETDSAKKTDVSTPLSKTQREKRLSPSSSPGARDFDSNECCPDTEQGNLKKTCVKKITREIEENVKKRDESSSQPRKRITCRAYSALFKPRRQVERSENAEDLDSKRQLSQACESGERVSSSKQTEALQNRKNEPLGGRSLRVANESPAEPLNSIARDSYYMKQRFYHDEKQDSCRNAKVGQELLSTALDGDRGVTEDGVTSGTGESHLKQMEDSFSSDCKSEVSKFIEYWVPVQISNIQLEQYCATLMSNSLYLRSSSRDGPVDVLRNTLTSTMKCCDHPYIIDQSLQLVLTKGLNQVEILDVGVRASGKLQLLDAMLKEMKSLGLKAVILFQSIAGGGRGLIGEILDDFMRQRFGSTSYERVEQNLASSKKQSAINNFAYESGRFVLLLEKRACHTAIKLSSVDAFIIFDSNINPLNDLRALQRITIVSKSAQTKVFRLYSSCTVEEKLLVLAKQKKIIDANPQNISVANVHALLMWGASYLFDKLEDFHSSQCLSTYTMFEQSFMEDVVRELSIILSKNNENNSTSKDTLILQAKCSKESYSTDSPLFGQQKVKLMDEEKPQVFWARLFNGKNPRWKYFSVNSEGGRRNRKRVQLFDGEVNSNEFVEKRRKVAMEIADQPSGHEEMVACGQGREGSPAHAVSQSSPRTVSNSDDTSHGSTASVLKLYDINVWTVPKDLFADNDERKKLLESQKSLHIPLKLDMAKLCKILHLPEEASAMAEKFLEYVLNNYIVSLESPTKLQALQISVCWVVMSLLKHKTINYKKSVLLAREQLNFGCKKDEAESVYYMLCCLKTLFLVHTGNLKVEDPAIDSEQLIKAADGEDSEARAPQGMANRQKGSLEGEESCTNQILVSEATLSQIVREDISESIRGIQKKFRKKMINLLKMQKSEKENVKLEYVEKKAKLEQRRKMEEAVVTVVHGNVQMSVGKLRKLDAEYENKIEELDKQLKDLETTHCAARTMLERIEEDWIEGVRSWAEVELVNLASNNRSSPEARSSDIHVDSTQCHDLASDSHRNSHDFLLPHGATDGVTLCSRSHTTPSKEAQVPGPNNCSRSSGLIGNLHCETHKIEVAPGVSEPIISTNTQVDVIPVTSSVPQQFCDVNTRVGVIPVASSVPQEYCEVNTRVDVIPVTSSVPQECCEVNTRADVIPVTSSVLQECCEVNPLVDVIPVASSVPQECCEVNSPVDVIPVTSSVPEKCCEVNTLVDVIPLTSSVPEKCCEVNTPVDVIPVTSSATQECYEVNTRVDVIPVTSSATQECYEVNTRVDVIPVTSSATQECCEVNTQVDVIPVTSCLPQECCDVNARVDVTPVTSSVPQGYCDVNTRVDLTPVTSSVPQECCEVNTRVDVTPVTSSVLQECCEVNTRVDVIPVTSCFPQESCDEPENVLGGGPDIARSDEFPENGHVLDGVAFTRTLPSMVPSSSSVPPMQSTSSTDPLQHELEELRKAMDQECQIHEDAKVRLKSECEKEIKEAVARIKSKYESQLREKETLFLTKRNEMEAKRNKIIKHQILIQTFNLKSSTRLAATLGSLQCSPNVARRPPTSLICPQVIHTVTTHSIPPTSFPLCISSSDCQSSSISQTPSVLARPHHVNHPPSATINLHRRARPPHLQLYRPSSFAVSVVNPSSHLPSMTPPPINNNLFRPPLATPRPVYCSLPCSHQATSQPTYGGISLPVRASLSNPLAALDVLFDMARTDSIHPPPDPASSANAVQPQHNNTNTIPVQLSKDHDVVCLSDDDA